MLNSLAGQWHPACPYPVRMDAPTAHRRMSQAPSRAPVHPPDDRRDPDARRALVDRIAGEFLEMRGVALTAPETARLMGVPPSACGRILYGLVREGALRQTADGRYTVADGLP